MPNEFNDFNPVYITTMPWRQIAMWPGNVFNEKLPRKKFFFRMKKYLSSDDFYFVCFQWEAILIFLLKNRRPVPEN